jgi:hypothetical protein
MHHMSLFKKWVRHRRHAPAAPKRVQLAVEVLESRLAPYAVSGNAWPHPNLVTLSFEPDGTDLGGVTSNLFSTFNNRFGSTAAWETPILKAAQTWAQQTNINFTVISDSGAATGSGNYQQGDSTMGDIRIGGYNYGTSTLASTYMPPPVNNYSLAGDISFNTGQAFNINGADYDLYTVALHEFGHALGLDHSSDSTAVMYATYNGVVTGLGLDDIAGIEDIYSSNLGRSYDSYLGLNLTSLTAADITSSINTTTLTGVVNNLNIATEGQLEYFKVTAPSGTTGTMTVIARSSGLSLLAPSLKIYNSNMGLLGSVTGTGSQGSTLTKSVSVTAGSVYYIRVTGATTTTPFGTGLYALGLNFGSNPNPSIPLPNTQTANGSPLHAGGGVAQVADPDGDTSGHDIFHPGQTQATPAGLPAAIAAAAPTAAGAASVAGGPAVSAGSSASTTLAAAMVPASAALGARTESGGGDTDARIDLEDQAEVLPPPAVALPSVSQGQESLQKAEPEAAAPAGYWRDACTACFEQAMTVDAKGTADATLSLAVEQARPVPDAATTAAALILVLGISAGTLRTPGEKEKETRKM